jgi:hypothetical protein
MQNTTGIFSQQLGTYSVTVKHSVVYQMQHRTTITAQPATPSAPTTSNIISQLVR